MERMEPITPTSENGLPTLIALSAAVKGLENIYKISETGDLDLHEAWFVANVLDVHAILAKNMADQLRGFVDIDIDLIKLLGGE